MHSVTRYLCAGAYLDTKFRNKVLDELLSDAHRAVAPSHGGFDIGPVAQHCLRARTILAVRDLSLVTVVGIGLIADPGRMATWLVMVVTLTSLLSSSTRGQPAQRRLAARAGLVTVVLVGGLLLFFGSVLTNVVQSMFTGELVEQGDESTGIGWLFVLATLAIVGGSRVLVGDRLAKELRPGAPSSPGLDVSPDIESRLENVNAAQWGNLTLYSAENPFLGAGQVARAWSIAVELDRVKSSQARELPVIDPQELHDFVGARLVQMRDEVARPAESLSLQISDHVIARGLVNQSFTADGTHPLIDPDTGRPVHTLEEEAVRAIVRHPKAGVRYYRRITIGTFAQEIRDEGERLVMPAEDQEIVVSAFVYLAVEGRMLYTEFVVTVLPPVADAYHLVDRLPRDGIARIALISLGVMRVQLLGDLVLAPFRLVRLGYAAIRDAFAPRRPQDYALYDYGARSSVRELGVWEGSLTYLQQLDSFKYTKLIGERLNSAVLDFLEESDIDTSAYRQQAAAVVNNGTMITGGSFNGPTAVGTRASVTSTTAPRQTGATT